MCILLQQKQRNFCVWDFEWYTHFQIACYWPVSIFCSLNINLDMDHVKNFLLLWLLFYPSPNMARDIDTRRKYERNIERSFSYYSRI